MQLLFLIFVISKAILSQYVKANLGYLRIINVFINQQGLKHPQVILDFFGTRYTLPFVRRPQSVCEQ